MTQQPDKRDVPWTPAEMVELLETHARAADYYRTSWSETVSICRDAAQTIRNLMCGYDETPRDG